MKPGTKYLCKNTASIRKSGIDPKIAEVTVLLVSNGFVSFRLQSGEMVIEARTTEEIFKENFSERFEEIVGFDSALIKKHFSRNFPFDFM